MTEHTEAYGHEHSAHAGEHAGEHAGGHGHAHVPSYGSYIMIWLGLVALTAITVTIAGMHLGSLTLTAALLIATVKTIFVGYYFMHLKFDTPIIKIFILICVFIFLTFWILTFSDLSFR
jgi:cytochrome c oxidase subunit 4